MIEAGAGELAGMTPSIYEAGDDRMVPDDEQMPEDDQMVPEEFTADPAGAVVDGVSGGADAERPSSVPPAGAPPRPAATHLSPSTPLAPAGRWNEIQAMFVDDPPASVELAAGLVDDSGSIHCYRPGGAMTREPRTCVSRCSRPRVLEPLRRLPW